ncbi:MAG: sugar ABC transporter permease [Chloroflexota bacterium]|nr:sugar ABC transporter permease [Chloroflexota bacterium]MDE3193118.1 sugar ABC transporter permease [Chloroflexota bacterium]
MRRRRREAIEGYLFLAPALLIIAAFHVWPAIYAFYMSLYRWEVAQEGFLGLRNYQHLLQDGDFLGSVGLTVVYVAGTVPVEMAVGLGVALLLHQRLRLRGVFRLLYFMPYVTSQVAVALVWGWIFNPTYGVANAILETVAGQPRTWLLQPDGVFSSDLPPSLALASIMFVTVWYYLGFHAVVFLSGLTSISDEVIDAARIDGAGGLRMFRDITFPLLSPTTYFLLLVATIGAMTSFNLVYVMSSGQGAGCGGGPLGTTRVAALFVFDRFWCQTELGYASAAAFAVGFVVVVITAINNRIFSRRVFYG